VKRALITGISGQDGSYLAELLLNKGYEVHGIIRQKSLEDKVHKLSNIIDIMDDINLHLGSIDDHLAVYQIVSKVLPDECYHLAASSFVSYSFDDESSVLSNNFNSTHYLLSSIKELCPNSKFYFAGSSEMFGNAETYPQNEENAFNPRSIYGISKLASYHLVNNYRTQHKLFASTGILFNHESPRRGYEFVTKKIVSSAVKVHLGLLDCIELGNINSVRDWGYAPDYVEGMWAILNHHEADNFVLSTGKLHSVKELLDIAFGYFNMNYKDYLKTSPQYYRPTENVPLLGDSTKAKEKLNWVPKKDFKEMICEMIESELRNMEDSK